MSSCYGKLREQLSETAKIVTKYMYITQVNHKQMFVTLLYD